MKVGKVERIKLGDIELDVVESEMGDYSAEVTDKPVEQGADISDHMKINNANINLNGVITEEDESMLHQLKELQKTKEPFTYVGRQTLDNVVIENISPNYSVENAEGFDFDIQLKQIRIAYPETFEINVKNPKTGKQDAKTSTKVTKSTSKGRQQLKKR